ncbi:hypothetical protein L1987_23467 [Smallanthus sonchifolius]|uniref:Uncharacterized protein n=1 Tax=Smallanthus sonchifolius TaxID=185202 RepID=A0ACB9IKC1_9ASTR|nr:hypothetical protein L1987_23467 [Smallanthus sonchifolius]
MKLAWKNKNNKRPITTISHLPFDQEEEDTAATDEGRCTPRESGSDHNSTAASHQLAESFEAQGNKLAEVLKYFSSFTWEPAQDELVK